MVPVIIDTSLSSYKSDSKYYSQGNCHQGKHTRHWRNDIRCKIFTDDGSVNTFTLKDCLLVPHCSIHILCPRQPGIATGFLKNGFDSLSPPSILTVNGKKTTLLYDTVTQLPLLYTTPGIMLYTKYLGNVCSASLPKKPFNH
jgi:hypothetical protein